MAADEEVLVVPAAVLARVGTFVGFQPANDTCLGTLFATGDALFLPRSQAEVDPRYIQIVPYAVLECGDELFTYQRGTTGGEARLHARWSMGVGGHIAREDLTSQRDRTANGAGNADPEAAIDGMAAYDAGYRRELAEELHLAATYQEQIIGLVYDPRTDVGRVHCGVVHRLTLAAPAATSRDPSMVDARWRTRSWVLEHQEQFESWSQFLLPALCPLPGS